MNKENMLATADLIEKHQEQFNMSIFGNLDLHNCNTAGCIAGFAATLDRSEYTSTPLKARLALDLTKPQSDSLFIDWNPGVWTKYAHFFGLKKVDNNGVKLSHIQPQHAVTMLRNLANGVWSFD